MARENTAITGHPACATSAGLKREYRIRITGSNRPGETADRKGK
jgi:hypothetical protein